jgi:hypothetical protein
MLSAQRTRLGYHFRAHRIFASAPPDIVHALARLVDKSDRHAAAVIDRYIDSNVEAIAEHARTSKIETRGTCFELQEIFNRLNARYFNAAVAARITWGKAGGPRRRSIKLGSYHATERLIRIHPALDQSFVPGFFIDFVIFHEMLHERLGVGVRGSVGRRCVHSPEFRALEARFPQAAEAHRWESTNLQKLLRYRPS